MGIKKTRRPDLRVYMQEWRNGRRDRLKICYGKPCVGSSPISCIFYALNPMACSKTLCCISIIPDLFLALLSFLLFQLRPMPIVDHLLKNAINQKAPQSVLLPSSKSIISGRLCFKRRSASVPENALCTSYPIWY